MDSPAADDHSPAPSPGIKGLKSVVAKAKIRKDDSSQRSPADPDDTGSRSALRNSVDSLVRNGTRSSVDDGLPSGPSNMSKLIPGRVKKKKKQREEAEKQLRLEEESRGRSMVEQPALAATTSNSRSKASLIGSEDNSLITLDSDLDSPALVAPPLTTRESHAGYLTSSSPLIKTVAPHDPPHLQLDGTTFRNPQYQKTTTLPNSSSNHSQTSFLAPQNPGSAAGDGLDRSPSASSRNRSRGVSPGVRIKDALSIGSKKKSGSPPKSPMSPTKMSDNPSNGLTTLLSKEKEKAKGLASSSTPSLTQGLGNGTSDGQQEAKPSLLNRPSTPTSDHSEPPPGITATPPTPVEGRRNSGVADPFTLRLGSLVSSEDPNTTVSASGNMISHRRIRSDSGPRPYSKLSNVMGVPLTPMAEERTPGVRTPSGNLTGGFFSSVFSAAQNVTSTLTNTINMGQPRSRSSTATKIGDENPLPAPEESQEFEKSLDNGTTSVKRPLAVETLGSGDLSLSHLGIDAPAEAKSINGSASDLAANVVLVQQQEAAARADEAMAVRAVSAAYSEKPSVTDGGATPVPDNASVIRPRSLYESSIATGDRTPPNGSIHEGDVGTKRSGSIRSRVGAVPRKHRNSSSATGASLGVGAGAATSTNLPASNGASAKSTGFAVASKKRNRDFHQSFRSVPEDDYLIEDYSCALQRDIILAGRIYISEGHICFSSNILGWVTTLVISFDEVVAIEKESTAMVFPNAIAIQTLHARHTFRSLLSRESTYELLVGIWKLSHPSIKTSVNGVRLDNADTGEKVDKASNASDDASDASGEDEVYDEDDDEQAAGSVDEHGNESATGSDRGDEDGKGTAGSRKVSSMGVAVGSGAASVPTASEPKAAEKATAASTNATDFPGPASHEPTECQDTHYDKMLKDDIIPAPLGKVYAMVFGSASGGFMARWLLDDVKCTDIQMLEDNKGLLETGASRQYTYIKPLNAPIGPKTTKCVVTETLDYFDLEKFVSVTASTQTPDVPSGGIFVTKTRFCLMWAPGNQTRAVMNYTIEWSGKSWIKSAIERGATDGQGQYCVSLVKALKAGIAARPSTATKGKTSKSGKRRKTERSGNSKDKGAATSTTPSQSSDAQASSWGVLDPLRPILGPIGDILSPFISANLIIGLLVLVILVNYLRSPSSKSLSQSTLRSTTSSSGPALGLPPSSPERVAAYEAIWRREEADLWTWLEQRVSAHAAAAANVVAHPGAKEHGQDHGTSDLGVGGKDKDPSEAVTAQSQKGEGTDMRKRLSQLRLGGREIEEAIRMTEERLSTLKEVVREEKMERERSEKKKA